MNEDFTAKGKKTRKRTRKGKPLTPGHAASEGYSDQLAVAEGAGEAHRFVPGICENYHEQTPDMGKSAEQMAASATVTEYPSVSSLNRNRVSPGLGRDQSHASVSSGDHGGSDGPGNRTLAHMHPSLRQASPDVQPFVRAGQASGATFVGQAAFGGEFEDTDTPPGADMGRPRLQTYNFAAQAGSFGGLSQPSYNPASRPEDFTSARGSGTPQNGTHSLSSPCSNAVANKSALDIMKDTMRRIG